jgi:hypothetical protein
MQINLREKVVNLFITIVIYWVYVSLLPTLGWMPNQIEIILYFIIPFVVIYIVVSLITYFIKGGRK